MDDYTVKNSKSHTESMAEKVQARSAAPFAVKVAGTLRRAVRSQAFAKILGERHMECAYYFEKADKKLQARSAVPFAIKHLPKF
jgi:hypothetical protein